MATLPEPCGQGNWRFIRYADNFAVMVSGEKHHAEALREKVAAVLAPLGLRLAPEKTRVVHIEKDGFDFLHPEFGGSALPLPHPERRDL